MKLLAYCIYDAKAAAFMPPFYVHTQGLAERSFSNAINDPSHQFHKYPGDFSLVKVGEFDDNTGTFNDTDNEFLYNGLQFKSMEEQHQQEQQEELDLKVDRAHKDNPTKSN